MTSMAAAEPDHPGSCLYFGISDSRETAPMVDLLLAVALIL